MDRATALSLWKDVLANSVKAEGPDLSARQAAILMRIYLEPGPHTVRGLAGALNLGKPAVSRALDALTALDLCPPPQGRAGPAQCAGPAHVAGRRLSLRVRRSHLPMRTDDRRRVASGRSGPQRGLDGARPPTDASPGRSCGFPSEGSGRGETLRRWRALPGGQEPRRPARCAGGLGRTGQPGALRRNLHGLRSGQWLGVGPVRGRRLCRLDGAGGADRQAGSAHPSRECAAHLRVRPARPSNQPR